MNSSLAKQLERIDERLTAIEQRLDERADDVLDIDGAVMLTGRSRSSLYQMTASHNGAPPELPHFKAGKRLYFKRSELIAWLTRNRVKSRTEIDHEAEEYTRARNYGRTAGRTA